MGKKYSQIKVALYECGLGGHTSDLYKVIEVSRPHLRLRRHLVSKVQSVDAAVKQVRKLKWLTRIEFQFLRYMIFHLI